MAAGDGSLFRAEAWRRPLERFSAATHLTVEVIGLDGQRLFEPISPTPVYDLIAGRGRDPQLLVACARQCLSQPAGAPPVVQRGYGLAVVGTPPTSAGKTVGSAVAGYAVAAFPDQRAVQRLALESQVPNAELWSLLRHQLPLASERVIVYGELLQTRVTRCSASSIGRSSSRRRQRGLPPNPRPRTGSSPCSPTNCARLSMRCWAGLGCSAGEVSTTPPPIERSR
jgi:hypothetical protein